MTDIDRSATPRWRSPSLIPGIVAAIALIAVAWSFLEARGSERERERTANALQLQVLGARLGVAAFEAEYGDFAAARLVASQAFDGIANYGIEQGALPQDYADVLARRDDVIAALATRDPIAGEQLMALFFGLQVPVNTALDPAHILPAADSGLGLEPPRRRTTESTADSAGLTTPAVLDSIAGRPGAATRRPDSASRATGSDSLTTRPRALRRDTTGGGSTGGGAPTGNEAGRNGGNPAPWIGHHR